MNAGPALEPARNVPATRARPGQMTAVMRAMSVGVGPKVIRIGIVQGGRVIEERVIKQRTTVTIGASEKATFVIASPAVPPLFELFQRVGDGYVLNVLHGMNGRIALASGITDLQSVREQPVKLTDDARGKIVVGDTTLLFQFVAAPPVQPRPQLPLAVKGGLATSNDWTLTFIAAFSFLLHFGLVGAMYSDWSDPIVGDRYDVAGLVDMMGKIPPPLVIDVPDPASNVTAPPTPTTPTEPQRTTSTTNVKPTPGTRPTGGPMSNDRAAALAARADAMEMSILAGIAAGPAVQGAIERSNIPPVDLGAAAERNAGVVRGNGELKVGVGGQPLQAANNKGLSVLGGPTKREGNDDAGKANGVAGPTGVAQVGVSITSTPVPGADATVAALRGRFRSCYQAGLLTDSTMSGKVLISARVGPNGEVTSSEIASMTGLSPAVGQCIANVVKRTTFGGPGGGGAALQIPVTFVQQQTK